MQEIHHFEYLGTSGRILLELNLKKVDKRGCTDLSSRGWGQVEGQCKCREFLD